MEVHGEGGPRDMNGLDIGERSIANQGNIHNNNSTSATHHGNFFANQKNYLGHTNNTNNFYNGSTPSPGPGQPCVSVGLPRNANCVERQDLLENLKEMLRDGKSHEPVGLWGLAGSGKTRLAIHYATQRLQASPKNCSVFWIHAKDEATFMNDVKMIARKARIDTSLNDKELLLAVREWIEDQPTWVMVVDGADNVELFAQDRIGCHQLREFALEGHNGTVIWTSQDRKILEFVGWARGVEVGFMISKEAVKLLELNAKLGQSFSNSEAALQLVEMLNFNPLVISHIASSMRAHSTLPEDMLLRLTHTRQRIQLLEAPRMDRIRSHNRQHSIFEALSSQAKRLADSDKAAYRIIAMVACLYSRQIPQNIFLVTGLETQNDTARKAIARLKELSLLHEHPTATDGPRYYIDDFVQEAILRHLNREASSVTVSAEANGDQQKQPEAEHETCYRSEAILLLSRKFPRRIFYDTLDLCKPHVGHALKATDEAPKRHDALVEAGDLLSAVGTYLYFCGRWREMEVPFQRALAIWEQCLEPDDSRIAAANDNLGWAHLKLGNHGQALELFLAARTIRTEVLELEETHTDVLTSNMNVAVTYREQDSLEKARPLLKTVFELRKEIFGEQHPDYVESMIEMAELYGRGSQSRKAVRPMGKALHLQSRHLGEDDPKTMQTKSYLGFFQGVHEKYSQAERTLEEVLGLQRKNLGQYHPHTLESTALLGWVRFKKGGDVNSAFDTLNEAVDGYEKVLGESHHKTKEALLMLADLYFAARDFTAAADIQLRVWNDNCRQHGEKHRDSLLVQMDLARTYHALGHDTESKKMGKAALDALCEKYGEEDPDCRKAAKQYAIIMGIGEEK